MTRRAWRLGWCVALLCACALFGLAKASAAERFAAGDGFVALVDKDRLYLEAQPEKGEGLLAFSRRLCGSSEAASAIAEANDGRRELKAGVRYRVPFDLLSPEFQERLAAHLFPQDVVRPDGWEHHVRGYGEMRRESLWHIAEWFTGTGENFREIRRHNGLSDTELAAGQTVTIPAELLRPPFDAVLPAIEQRSPEDFGLTFGADSKGSYAVYRLQPGEALYSSVVVRFTGRLLAADVNALAEDIARRSGIADVTDIPVDYAVKIPTDLLLPEFLPADDPRRREYEAGLRASARFSNRVRARDLQGITVILDPGHGGGDPGASLHGVWESLYVYDISLRVRRLLEERTAAKVELTTRDGEHFHIHNKDVLPFSRSHAVQTSPPYKIVDSRVSANLRWYLANSIHRRAIKATGDADKTIFLSIHADSLHPSLRGATVYIPAASMTGGTFGKRGEVYKARREYREKPRLSFSSRERVRSEGLSRQLAEAVLEQFRRSDLAIHPTKPIREKIIRKRSSFVPAVLRYNSVPGKILLEVGNLANAQDRKLLQTRAFRQTVAEAIVQGILDYYDSGESGGSTVRVAKRAE
ncbi:MAG: N-acetylmuramoyl-L-alanine amidase [Acidobacteriota bacterium]